MTENWIFSKIFPSKFCSLCSFDPHLQHSSIIFNLACLDRVAILLIFSKDISETSIGVLVLLHSNTSSATAWENSRFYTFL